MPHDVDRADALATGDVISLPPLLPEAPGTRIANWSVGVVLGASRALAAVVILDAVIELQLGDALLKTTEGKRLLQSLKYVHATYTPAENKQELAVRSILAKMHGLERQRPDVLQLVRTFEAMAAAMRASETQSSEDLLNEAVKLYNSSAQVASIRVMGNEGVAVKFVAGQSPEFREELAKCWRRVKAKDGPVTVSLLAQPWLRQVVRTTDPLWRNILQPTPGKLLLWLRRVIRTWRARVLRSQAQTGRDLATTAASRPVQHPHPAQSQRPVIWCKAAPRAS